ncbi:MAG: hypothetical protein KGR26_07295, partial [Cyanobacteria bacterium REEB65]|nr:hypothetical protein [Cyanobacteria bacterium REEB65]
ATWLPKVFPGWFTSWDRFCLSQRHFDLPILDLPAMLGPSGFETLAGILAADPRLKGRRLPSGKVPIAGMADRVSGG